jgi:hypothetical protein
MNTKSEGAHRGMGAGFSIECRNYKPFTKNTLVAFVTLMVSPPGLTVNDICLHEKNGRRWLSFPAKSYPKDGATEWWPVVVIEDKEVLKQFQSAWLEAIDRFLLQGGESHERAT